MLNAKECLYGLGMGRYKIFLVLVPPKSVQTQIFKGNMKFSNAPIITSFKHVNMPGSSVIYLYLFRS